MSRRPSQNGDDDDDDDNHDDDNHDDNDKNSTEQDIPLLGESQFTDEERRQIRKEQRDLLKELEDKDALDVEVARGRNNRLYKKVRYTREAVLDGENLMSIAHKASQKVDRLIQVPRYDADRLVHRLVGKVRAEHTNVGGTPVVHFDWELLGEAAGACFNAIPSDVCFLNGPLQKDAPPVQRKVNQQRRTHVHDDAVEERPEDVQGHTEKDDNKLSAIEKSMQDMAKELKHKVDHQYRENKRKLEQAYGKDKTAIPKDVQKKFKKYGVEIDALQFLFNPRSFTQTVENIFHYSFLVKKGTGAIAVRDEKGLHIEGLQTKPGLKIKYVSEDKTAPVAKQSVMTLTMQDWRALCEAYHVDEGGLPHRKVHKEAYANSLSQASGIPSSS